MALEQLTVNCTNTEQGSNHKYGVAPVSHPSALQRCACSMPGSSTKPIDAAFQGDYSARDKLASRHVLTVSRSATETPSLCPRQES